MDDIDVALFIRGVDPDSCDSSAVLISYLAEHPGFFVSTFRRKHYEGCSRCQLEAPEIRVFFQTMDAARLEGIIAIFEAPSFLLHALDEDLDEVLSNAGILTPEELIEDCLPAEIPPDHPSRKDALEEAQWDYEVTHRARLRGVFRARMTQVLAQIAPLFYEIPFAQTADLQKLADDDLSEVPSYLRKAVATAPWWGNLSLYLPLGRALAEIGLTFPLGVRLLRQELPATEALKRFFPVQMADFDEWMAEGESRLVLDHRALHKHVSCSVLRKPAKMSPEAAQSTIDDLRGDATLIQSGNEAQFRGVIEKLNEVMRLVSQTSQGARQSNILEHHLGEDVWTRLSQPARDHVREAEVLMQNLPKNCGGAWNSLRKALEAEYTVRYLAPVQATMAEAGLETIVVQLLWITIPIVIEQKVIARSLSPAKVIPAVLAVLQGKSDLKGAGLADFRERLERRGLSLSKCERLNRHWNILREVLNEGSHFQEHGKPVSIIDVLRREAAIKNLFSEFSSINQGT